MKVSLYRCLKFLGFVYVSRQRNHDWSHLDSVNKSCLSLVSVKANQLSYQFLSWSHLVVAAFPTLSAIEDVVATTPSLSDCQSMLGSSKLCISSSVGIAPLAEFQAVDGALDTASQISPLVGILMLQTVNSSGATARSGSIAACISFISMTVWQRSYISSVVAATMTAVPQNGIASPGIDAVSRVAVLVARAVTRCATSPMVDPGCDRDK